MNPPRLRLAAPRDVALAMLDARFGVIAPASAERGLAEFQQDALARVTALLSRRHGAILADSVGLGKTHVAAALIRRCVGEGDAVLLSAPAMLLAHWRRHLRGVRRWRWCSHTSLSRGSTPARGPWKLIVVDEAHALRNPDTQRYRVLARLCAGADVLLLTATPVNNALLDFYHLVRLFAGDAAFHDIGVPDLRAAFDDAARSGDARDVRRVAEAVMVRRTRAFIARHYQPGDGALRFPASAPIRTLTYDLELAYAGGIAAVLDAVMSLRFPAHSAARDAGATALLRLGLLKRLESSNAAFHASLRRHLRVVTAFEAALRDGFILDARDYRALAAEADGATQLLLDAAVLRAVPSGWDAARARCEAAADAALLRGLLREERAAAGEDPKLALLRALIAGQLDAERVLIFTEFRETAAAIWRSLRAEFRCALITGAGAYLGVNRAGRRTVIERFAPFANGVRAPPARERVDVLVTTDVLAEGLNLQDARVVISYDLPWNPVRLAQRIGRIDRLGSPHATIEAFAFSPDRRLDTLLGLLRRLRRKLRAIRLVGGDAPWLTHSLSRAGVAAAASAMTSIDPAQWDIVEELRAEHRRRRSERVASTAWVAGADIPVAVIEWRKPRAATLCCVVVGDSVRLRMVDGSGRCQEADATVDQALLDALRVDAGSAAADMRRVSRAVELAVRGLVGETVGTARIDASRRRAAALVHRWLAARPMSPTDAEYARADRMLGQLRRAAAAELLESLVRSMAGPGSLDTRVDRLEAALSSGPVGAASAAEPQVIAVLQLVPRRAATPAPTLPGGLSTVPAAGG